MDQHIKCKLEGECSGCSWIRIDPTSQQEQKEKALRLALEEVGFGSVQVEYIRPSLFQTRNRADLTLSTDESGNTRLGLYSISSGRRDILDMPQCPQLEVTLETFLKEFRSDLPRIKKGSVRLRVAVNGQRGIWLDLSNVDIKEILDSGDWLDRHQNYYIEVGQKRKKAVKIDRWKLSEGEPQAWSFSFLSSISQAIPLYSHISSFTQPGTQNNRVLIQQVLKIIKNINPSYVLELGAGSGNFTLPLMDLGVKVLALEMDFYSENNFKVSLENAQKIVPTLNKSLIEWHVVDFTRVNRVLPITEGKSIECLLVDPPRSGLGHFVKDVLPKLNIENIIYISCFLESFKKDLVSLKELNYDLKDISIVDQFPHSPHAEFITWLKK